MIFYLFVFGFVALYGWLNYQVGVWLWKHFFINFAIFSVKGYLFVFSLFVLTGFLGMILNRTLPSFLQNGVYIVASYWLVSFFYLIILIALYEFLRHLNKWLGFFPPTVKDNFLVGFVVVLTVSALLIYGTLNAKNLKVTSYHVNLPKQAGSMQQLKVAFLTDLHLSDLGDRRMEKFVKVINQLNPDIVLIAGDIVDANRDSGTACGSKEPARYFAQLKSKYGIYASLGNHDYDYHGDGAERLERFQQAGLNVLRDSSVKIADDFYLVGREDISYERIGGRKRQELSVFLENLDGSLPVLVLEHQPVSLSEAKNAGVDLLLCGHTHKGQVFPMGFLTKKIYTFDYGHLKLDNFQAIISSGAGTWGPPLRIGSNSEIVSLTINFR